MDVELQAAVVAGALALYAVLMTRPFQTFIDAHPIVSRCSLAVSGLGLLAGICVLAYLTVAAVSDRIEPPTAVVSVPTEGDPVDHWPYDGFRATVHNLPRNEEPVIVVYDKKWKKYNPASHICAVSGGGRSGNLTCDPL
jgi:hypothetical protein